MLKNKKSKLSWLIWVFFIGSIVFLFVIMVIFKTLSLTEQKKIIAPYFQQKDLKVPVDIKINTATLSAKNKKIVSHKIPIIMYHYVEYVKDLNDTIRMRLDISPAVFEAELKTLHDAGYKTYFVKDIPNLLNGSLILASKGVILTFDDGYEDFYKVVYPLLKKYQIKATLYIITDFINRKGFLNDKELIELSKSDLIEIGSHTLDHLYLKSVSKTIAEKQIKISKKVLEDKLGVKIETFAYPYGAFNQDVLDLVKEAGYSAAVSVIPGSIQSEKNIMYLSRIRPGMFSAKTIVSFLENYKN